MPYNNLHTTLLVQTRPLAERQILCIIPLAPVCVVPVAPEVCVLSASSPPPPLQYAVTLTHTLFVSGVNNLKLRVTFTYQL